MPLTPDQRGRLQAGAQVAGGLLASRDWWQQYYARQRQDPASAITWQEAVANQSMIVVGLLEDIVDP